MANIAGVVQMLRIEHDRLAREMNAIGRALSAFGASYGKQWVKRRTMSAGVRARIAAAQRLRWAKMKANDAKSSVVTLSGKRKMSTAARRRIAAAQCARWAKVRAGKKSG